MIYIGYPNWWAYMPMPIYTFIEKHNWQNKTVIPFCTHEGSGLSNTEDYIKEGLQGCNKFYKAWRYKALSLKNHKTKQERLYKIGLPIIQNKLRKRKCNNTYPYSQYGRVLWWYYNII